MEKSPDHGPHAVEQAGCLIGLSPVDDLGPEQESEVHIGFFRLGVGDAPVVKLIATTAPVAFTEIRGDRGRAADELIGDRFQRRRHTPREFESDAGTFDGSFKSFEFLFGLVVTHGGLRFVHAYRGRL